MGLFRRKHNLRGNLIIILDQEHPRFGQVGLCWRSYCGSEIGDDMAEYSFMMIGDGDRVDVVDSASSPRKFREFKDYEELNGFLAEFFPNGGIIPSHPNGKRQY